MCVCVFLKVTVGHNLTLTLYLSNLHCRDRKTAKKKKRWGSRETEGEREIKYVLKMAGLPLTAELRSHVC